MCDACGSLPECYREKNVEHDQPEQPCHSEGEAEHCGRHNEQELWRIVFKREVLYFEGEHSERRIHEPAFHAKDRDEAIPFGKEIHSLRHQGRISNPEYGVCRNRQPNERSGLPGVDIESCESYRSCHRNQQGRPAYPRTRRCCAARRLNIIIAGATPNVTRSQSESSSFPNLSMREAREPQTRRRSLPRRRRL